MARCTYFNGRYLPTAYAFTNVEDRGYMFADGVYEAIALHNGIIVDLEPHITRLRRSLEQLEILWPVSENAFKFIIREVVRRNARDNGTIYIQITRGVAPRSHLRPEGMKSTLLVTLYNTKPPSEEMIKNGTDVITRPDIRWRRCDIKSLALLPNTMLKRQAFENDVHETVMFDENGYVTEGTSTNVWIYTDDNELVTRPLGDEILSGVVRQAIKKIAEKAEIKVVERLYTVEEMKKAKDVFLTGTTSNIKPIVNIDGDTVADGKPGEITKKLIKLYYEAKNKGGCA